MPILLTQNGDIIMFDENRNNRTQCSFYLYDSRTYFNLETNRRAISIHWEISHDDGIET